MFGYNLNFFTHLMPSSGDFLCGRKEEMRLRICSQAKGKYADVLEKEKSYVLQVTNFYIILNPDFVERIFFVFTAVL